MITPNHLPLTVLGSETHHFIPEFIRAGFIERPQMLMSPPQKTIGEDAAFILREIAKASGLESDSFQLGKNELGKPVSSTLNGDLMGVSISHSQEVLAAALNRSGEIGIDIERTDRKVPEKLLTRILHPQESLDKSSPIIQIWTLKEAVLKCTGTGLRTNMNSIFLRRQHENLFITEFLNKPISVVSFEKNNHWFSIAYTH